MSANIIAVAENNFEQEVLTADISVLVDFWAEWCGPCKMLSPVLDKVASNANYDGKLKIVKLNVDENENVAAKYGVRTIPTLMIFRSGHVEATKVGALTESQLMAFIEPYI